LSDEAALHRLRIRAKKLRYTMEMVAVAFKPSFRRKLYPRISMLQDILGIVNDHAMGRRFFREWAEKEESPQEKGFLEGMTVAEARAFADVRQTFLAAWTPKAAAELRREFRKCCGV
jgi:CHAD domain-containing protein